MNYYPERGARVAHSKHGEGTVRKNDYIARNSLVCFENYGAVWVPVSELREIDKDIKLVVENSKEIRTIAYDYSGTVVEYKGQKYQLQKL